MNRILVILLTAMVLMSSCKKEEAKEAFLLNTAGIAALGPYLTKNQKGDAVLCWTEQGTDSLNRLKYAVYDEHLAEFGSAITVEESAGCSASAESMGKIAFKDDGTVIAVFAKRFLKEKNPYAGAIYFSVSDNSGKTWSRASFLHSDTSHTYGRSFFDIARLKDGELAAVWLDGRFGRTIKGSALFFSRTEKGKGFGVDVCLEKGTCECCRTNMLTDTRGNIHLAYRSITFPEPLSGKQVRDMVYKQSSDNGRTFSNTQPISNDNWEIEGCPHSGPSLAVSGSSVYATWFTAAGSKAGIYSSTAHKVGDGFDSRKLVTAAGRHPQMISLSGARTAMVCEEIPEPAANHAHGNHADSKSAKTGHKKGTMDHDSAVSGKIVLRLMDDGNPIKTMDVSDGHSSDSHAVLAPVADGVIVAWLRANEAGSKIYYKNVKI